MTTYSTIPTQTREYPLATFWRYFVYVSLIGFIGLFGWLAYYLPTDGESNIPYYVTVPVALLLISGCIYLITRARNEKLLIEYDRFVHTEAYSSCTLYFNEVKGFMLDDNYIHIIPLNRDVKKIKLTKYIARASELKQYLADNFNDLDRAGYDEQLTEILNDPELGFTEEERDQKLKKAKLLSNIINWPSYIICGLLFFYPTPYVILMTIAVLWPLLAVAVLKSNSLIRFDEEKNSPYPGITYGFFMPLAGLGLRLVSDLSLVNFNNIWLPSVTVFVILMTVLFAGNNAFNFSSGKKKASSILIMVFVYLYCFTASVTINCLYDTGAPTEYRVKVVDKNISSGKSKSYNLVLEKWGPQTEGEQEMVSYKLYNRTQIGDSVTVACRDGILSAPWYSVY